jgi:hypothetical protein
MEKAGTIWSRRRSWTAIALVLVALALLQACGSDKSSGPSSGPAVQLKLRRVTGAEIPSNCGGVYSVSGPGVNINNKALPNNGQISFQGTIGQTYFVSVQLTCGVALVSKQGEGLAETLSGSTSITLVPGINEATITLQVSKVLGLSCASPVAPGQTSKCTCSVQSPGPASIGWQGATPSGSNTANFVNNTPGSYPVTCTVNGVAVATTTVVVQAASEGGTIRVENTGVDCELNPQLCLRRRQVLAQLQFGGFTARVRKLPSGPVSGNQEVNPSQTKSFGGLAAGDYQVEFSCTTTFGPEPNATSIVTLPQGGTVTVGRNGFNLCGFSLQQVQGRRR